MYKLNMNLREHFLGPEMKFKSKSQSTVPLLFRRQTLVSEE